MYSTLEVANILHLSRVAIFQKIQSGEIKAQKVGRNYVIPYESLEEILGKTIGTTKKEEIEKAVDRAIHEYGDVFKKLGKE
ncbi:MAG: helix-turn-helix domain-containing protein [Candidatus Paceibacterota bacterium]